MSKLIIFDFDGTVADTQGISYLVYKELAIRNGFHVMTKEEYLKMNQFSLKKKMNVFGGSLFQLPKYVRQAMPIFRQHIQTASLFPNMKEIFTAMKQKGYTLAIVSSNNTQNIKIFLEKHEIHEFDKVVGGVSIFGKSRKIKRLIVQMKYSTKTAIYIGDEIRDIQACKKIGVKVVAVTWGYEQENVLIKGNPEYLIDAPLELLEII